MDEFTESSDGVVLDLGVSSFQFDQPGARFLLREDGPLDMRMSLSGESAADFVNSTDERTLSLTISRYGEEKTPAASPAPSSRRGPSPHGGAGQDRSEAQGPAACATPSILPPAPSRHCASIE